MSVLRWAVLDSLSISSPATRKPKKMKACRYVSGAKKDMHKSVQLTESVVQGMVSQPIVLHTWKGRNRLYKTVTVHKWTRYLCTSGQTKSIYTRAQYVRKGNRRGEDTLQAGQRVYKLVQGVDEVGFRGPTDSLATLQGRNV